MLDVFVAGSGISGLSLAYILMLRGLEVVAVDSSREAGGKIGTLQEDGYIVEKGPNGFLDNKPYTFDLVNLLGLSDELIPCTDNSKERYIYLKGRLVRVPVNPIEFLRSSILSPIGKMRVLLEPLIPPLRDEYDETVAEFGSRRLGSEFVDNILDPMVTGVFAGDCYRLSLEATFPVMRELERRYGGLFKALLKRKREGTLKRDPSGFSRLYSFKRGLSTLIDAISEKLRNRGLMRLGEPVVNIRFSDGHWIVTTDKDEYKARVLVISLPSYVSARLLSFNEELSNLLEGIYYAPIVVVAFGGSIKKGDIPRGFGFLVPKREGRSILGCLFDYQIFDGRAPYGKVLLRVMLGGVRNPKIVDFDDRFIVGAALYDVESIVGFNLDIERVWLFRYEKGIPQYERGHLERLRRIEELVSSYPGLFLHGNAYRGVGINDCIGNSFILSQKIADYLGV
ncbi:MAG: protoporphyrinogen oxidase [Thermosulfidibacteraceae bacterium]